MENTVDNKYYLGKTKDFSIKNSFSMEEKGNGFRFAELVRENAQIVMTIITNSGLRMDDNFIFHRKS